MNKFIKVISSYQMNWVFATAWLGLAIISWSMLSVGFLLAFMLELEVSTFKMEKGGYDLFM